jgi:putative NADH-flavin reductase
VKVILFAATGMVGQGVLRECLRDPEIAEVLAIGRSATGQQNAKLREAAREDLVDLSDIARTLMAYDACFFCLGVSSAGMKEEAYKRVTYDLTTAVARSLAQQNPGMTFCMCPGRVRIVRNAGGASGRG